MLYIKLKHAVPVAVKHHRELDRKNDKLAYNVETETIGANGWISRHDIGTLQYASTLASILTEKLGKTYLAVDEGPGHYPRFDVIEAPMIGAPVSYAFNGDYTPCGTISKITRTWQITTSTGKKFRRSGDSSSWRMTGGTWSMVSGHISERNPSF